MHCTVQYRKIGIIVKWTAHEKNNEKCIKTHLELLRNILFIEWTKDTKEKIHQKTKNGRKWNIMWTVHIAILRQSKQEFYWLDFT